MGRLGPVLSSILRIRLVRKVERRGRLCVYHGPYSSEQAVIRCQYLQAICKVISAVFRQCVMVRHRTENSLLAVEVMRDTDDGAEIIMTEDLPAEDLLRVVQMRQLAFASWWAPGHPGWGIIDALGPPESEPLVLKS